MNSVAETSGLIGWISLAMGVAVAALVIVLNANAHDRRSRRAGLFLAVVEGSLLLTVAAVLAALGGGRELWLTGLGGFLCLAVGVAIRFDQLEKSVSGEGVVRDPVAVSFQTLEAAQEVNRLRLRVKDLVAEAERAVEANERLSSFVHQLDPAAAMADSVAPDLPALVHALVAQGLWGVVSVYTTDDDGTPLKSAVVEVLHAFELSVVAEEPVVRASWFQRFWVRAHSESVRERLRKAEQAIELQYLGKARAEIDQAKAQAVAALLQAISAQENAVLRVGSLIAVKSQGDLAVWTVSELEAADMERHGALLRDPISALEYLRELKRKPLQQNPEE